jgi:hypothetical protein
MESLGDGFLVEEVVGFQIIMRRYVVLQVDISGEILV